MKRNYKLECYSKNGYVVLMNECVAESTEAAVEQFARELINIQEEDPDFEEEIAYAILDELRCRYTISFDQLCSEFGPTDKIYDFTRIIVQLDINY